MTETLLPEHFVRTIVHTFGDAGSEWLTCLPALLTEAEHRWNLTLLPAFVNLSYNYVAPAMCADGTAAVLKAGVPCPERQCEIAALRNYDGRGCVRMLAADEEQGVILLERLNPGTPLTALADDANDARATSIAVDVMRRLWRPTPPGHVFPTVADWGRGMERLRTRYPDGTGPFPIALMEEAQSLWKELLANPAPPVLLHGDLHHDNILRSGANEWLAIDPKGLVGEPAYEVGALVRNLWPAHHTLADPAQTLARRVHQLAEELDLSRERVRGWAVAQAVLSAWWCIEDNDPDWQDAIAIAEQIAAVKV